MTDFCKRALPLALVLTTCTVAAGVVGWAVIGR